ncbi:MAG: type 4a pilus biogenesis protein PilO [Myxococcota bacterium]
MEQFLEKFTKIPLQHKLGGLLGALLLMAGLDWFLVVDGQMTLLKELSNPTEDPPGRLQKVEKKLLEKQQQAANLTTYKREVERLKQQVKEAQEQLPTQAEIPKLMRDVAYEGQQSGLVVKRFELSGEQQKGAFSSVPVKMAVEGSYHEVAVFLDRLSKMPRIVNVTQIQLRSPRVVNKKIVLQGEYLATTYRFLEGNVAAAAQ